ncbi:MAG: hypothetical protein KJ077_41845 [Anaerolineae bacterium]|nr:hypothetical protein [Anaerolineae bacterium]
MLKKIRGKLIWLGLGVILATWLSYEYSYDWMYSLILGGIALMIGAMVLSFYAAGQAE